MEDLFKGKSYTQASFAVYNQAKIYPDGSIKVFEFVPHLRKLEPGMVASSKLVSNPTTPSETSDERSLRRSKTRISDLVLSNPFDMFATLTFKDNRQDMIKCKNRMKDWLKSQQKIHGNFQYLIVPEFHKDGKSLHFHALMNNYKGQLTDSGHTINTRKAYNIKSYRSGFSTVVMIDNQAKVANYVKKYITKDMPKISNKKRYWRSYDLKQPRIEHNINLKRYELTELFRSDGYIISTAVLKKP